MHCKSEHEKGVREAAKTCYDLHMENVFAASPAKILVVLGKVAKEALLVRTPSFPRAPQEMNL
ncbi:MAG: hypothetical protein WAK84_07065 [Candidatus Cybelea sp.]